MPAVKYLIKSDHEVLNDWGQARRVEEHTRRQLAWRRQQERRLDGKEGMALRVRLKEASAAELEARMRAHKVGGAICLHLLGGARASFLMDAWTACWAVGLANLAWPGLAWLRELSADSEVAFAPCHPCTCAPAGPSPPPASLLPPSPSATLPSLHPLPLQLGKFLKEKLGVECSSGGPPGERQSAADQERQVAALLRLASMPLPDFRRLLEEGPAGGRAVQGVAAAAGEGADVADAMASEVRRAAAAAAADNEVADALQLLLSGTVGAAQFWLPKALQQQLCKLQGRSSPGGSSPSSAASPASIGSGDSGRQRFQRQLEQLVSDPDALAECKRQLLEEVAELRLVLGSADVAPEQSPPVRLRLGALLWVAMLWCGVEGLLAGSFA